MEIKYKYIVIDDNLYKVNSLFYYSIDSLNHTSEEFKNILLEHKHTLLLVKSWSKSIEIIMDYKKYYVNKEYWESVVKMDITKEEKIKLLIENENTYLIS